MMLGQHTNTIFRGGAGAKMQIFLVVSTCLLYLVAAGLFSRAVWSFEQQKWNKLVGGDAAEAGAGPGSYDIDNSVWHVNCCAPELPGTIAWGILNAIFGWTNSATYGSVISYNVYWIFVMAGFILLRYKESTGHWPFVKTKAESSFNDSLNSGRSGSESNEGVVTENKSYAREQTASVSN